MLWIFDFANLLVCLLTISIAYRIKIVPSWIALILASYTFLPFLLNDFLLPSRYMGDQYLYFSILKNVRSFDFLSHEDPKVLITSWSLSIMPLPYVEGIRSVGLFNRYMFLILFIWIYHKKFLNGLPLYFILFFPSLVFYTSLGLRDPLVLIFMILGVIFLIEKKYSIAILVIIPLYFIKFQNFYFLILLYFLYLLFEVKKKYRNLLLSLVFLISLPILHFFFDSLLAALDFYRGALFKENGGNITEYQSLTGAKDLLKNSIIAFPYFLLKPFPWEATNTFQTIQSYENIFVVIFLIFFTSKSYFQSSSITIKWLIFFIFTITIYGITVYNFGTSARYRYPLIVIYVIGLTYDLFKNKDYRFKNIFKKTSSY